MEDVFLRAYLIPAHSMCNAQINEMLYVFENINGLPQKVIPF